MACSAKINKTFVFASLLLILSTFCLSSVSANRRIKSGRISKEFGAKIGATGGTGTEKVRNHRRGKLFSLFNVVTFNNDPCASNSVVNGQNRNGTCFTATECEDKSGTSSGNCAAGFGVCCIFTVDGTNGRTTIDQNCTYIQNEGFTSPTTGASTATFTVNKCSDSVCFLRLDFETFTMLGTNGSNQANEGTCVDSFVVTTPTGENIPTICGENRGQHMYIDIGANAGDTATIAITTTADTFDRTWDIKVTQVECNNGNAPRDASCLQYHTGLTGRLTNFNYDNTNDNHLNNQQYSICIRPMEGFCCVEYRVCEDQLIPVSGSTITKAGFSFDTRTTSKNDSGCDSNANSFDYIGITASGATCAMAGGTTDRAVNNQYCGSFLNQVASLMANTPICDCTGPFQVDVFFNNFADGQNAVGTDAMNSVQSRGFCLDYRQIAC